MIDRTSQMGGAPLHAVLVGVAVLMAIAISPSRALAQPDPGRVRANIDLFLRTIGQPFDASGELPDSVQDGEDRWRFWLGETGEFRINGEGRVIGYMNAELRNRIDAGDTAPRAQNSFDLSTRDGASRAALAVLAAAGYEGFSVADYGVEFPEDSSDRSRTRSSMETVAVNLIERAEGFAGGVRDAMVTFHRPSGHVLSFGGYLRARFAAPERTMSRPEAVSALRRAFEERRAELERRGARPEVVEVYAWPGDEAVDANLVLRVDSAATGTPYGDSLLERGIVRASWGYYTHELTVWVDAETGQAMGFARSRGEVPREASTPITPTAEPRVPASRLPWLIGLAVALTGLGAWMVFRLKR